LSKKKVRFIAVTGYGTHCEMEMVHGCHLGGSDVVDIVGGMGVAFFRNAVHYIRDHLL